MKKHLKAMVGTLVSVRNLAVVAPRTTKAAHALLTSTAKHFQGDNELPELKKAIRRIRVKWAPKIKTSRKRLERIHQSTATKRRRLYQTRVVVLKKDTVATLRDALPKMYGQGYLRRRISVFPYRPMDTFFAQHKVNVYQNGSRFDVIDALCNIPILSGITRRHLKGVVAW